MRLLTVVLGRPRNSRTTVVLTSICERTAVDAHCDRPRTATAYSWAALPGAAPPVGSGGDGTPPASARSCDRRWRRRSLPPSSAPAASISVDGQFNPTDNSVPSGKPVLTVHAGKFVSNAESGLALSTSAFEKLVRTHPLPHRCPTGRSCLPNRCRPVGSSEPAPHSGAGVVFMPSYFFDLTNHLPGTVLFVSTGETPPEQRPPDLLSPVNTG